MDALSPALALLEELRRRAGLEAVAFEAGRFNAVVFDEVLVRFREAEGGDALELLACVPLAAGAEDAILRAAMTDADSRAGHGVALGFDGSARALTIRDTLPAAAMRYPEFEQRLGDFVDCCEGWFKRADAAGPTGSGDLPSGAAIFA